MAIDADALLAGPRGRRLCLALATAAGDHDLRSAVMFAAYHLDVAAGSSVVVVTVPPEAAAPIPHVTPEDVAARLAELRMDDPSEAELMDALATAVDTARYWQEPDGDDVLAATPAVREALRPVAARLGRSPAVEWWSTPMRPSDQWRVTFDPRPADAPDHRADDALTAWRDAVVAEETRARRERPADPRASWSGTWWSTPPATLTRTTRRVGPLGPAGLRLVEDSLGWTEAAVVRVDVPRGARVLEIDGPEAWAALCRRHPMEVTASRRHDWFRATGQASRWVVPDWSAVAADVDAVHVSVRGYLTTAGRAVPVADDVSTVLAGWGPDETVWLTDVEPAAHAPERWARDDDVGWHPVTAE